MMSCRKASLISLVILVYFFDSWHWSASLMTVLIEELERTFLIYLWGVI